jgi:hypothetical protein
VIGSHSYFLSRPFHWFSSLLSVSYFLSRPSHRFSSLLSVSSFSQVLILTFCLLLLTGSHLYFLSLPSHRFSSLTFCTILLVGSHLTFGLFGNHPIPISHVSLTFFHNEWTIPIFDSHPSSCIAIFSFLYFLSQPSFWPVLHHLTPVSVSLFRSVAQFL